MKTTASKLLEELKELTRQNLVRAEQMADLDTGVLNYREAEGRWSALECLQHLNLYGDFYLEEIARKIQEHKHPRKKDLFVSGWLGNYFAKTMYPGEKMVKMPTFKDKNPLGSELNKSTVAEFIRQQREMLQLLEAAEKVDLSRTKTGITITRFIRFRLGDTFRFVIYHNLRHLVQAEKAIAHCRAEEKG